MKVILILVSWSSGSTAVSGFFDKCGCYTCPPHFSTNDVRTPNAYEPKEYRDALAECIDELTLKQVGAYEVFSEFFAEWLPNQMEKAQSGGCEAVVLKHPLQSFLLREISTVCDPINVVVTRPFSKIEATRKRRKWGPVYGMKGAEAIYGRTYSYLHINSQAHLSVPYEKFRESADLRQTLLDFCGLQPSSEKLRQAVNWLK